MLRYIRYYAFYVVLHKTLCIFVITICGTSEITNTNKQKTNKNIDTIIYSSVL